MRPAWPRHIDCWPAWPRTYWPKLKTSKKTRKPCQVSCFYERDNPIWMGVHRVVFCLPGGWHGLPKSPVRVFGRWRAADGVVHAKNMYNVHDHPWVPTRAICGAPDGPHNNRIPRRDHPCSLVLPEPGIHPRLVDFTLDMNQRITCERCIADIDRIINPIKKPKQERAA